MAIDLAKHKPVLVKTHEAGKLAFLQKEISFGKKFGDKQKERFYNELTTLLNAGVDINGALEILQNENFKKHEKAILIGIKDCIVSGKSFSAALMETGHFSKYEVYSIKIGEESGRILQIVKELGLYFSKRIKLKRQMTGIFTYPVFLLVVSTGILYFMLNNVVPIFSDVFKKFGKELPAFTQKVISLSNWTQAYFVYVVLVLMLIVGFLYWNRNKVWFRKYSFKLLFALPMFGKLFHKVYLARFAQSMTLLINAKTPITEALALVEKMIACYPIEVALSTIRSEITKGISLNEAMRKHKVFDSRMVSLIKVAEEVNQLDAMFERLAHQYNDELEHQTAIAGKLVEPILILVIGAMVGIILIAMYQPMFEMNNLME